MIINDIIITIGKHGKEMESNEESLVVGCTNQQGPKQANHNNCHNPNPKK